MARKVRRKSPGSPPSDTLMIGRANPTNAPKVKVKPTPAPQLKGPPTPVVKGPPSPKPDGNVVDQVLQQPKVRKTVRRQQKRHDDYIGLNPDRATPNGGTHGQDGRSGDAYRDVVKHLLYQARKKAGVVSPGYTASSTPTSSLEAELDLLHHVGPMHDGILSSPRWYDRRTGAKVNLNQIAQANDSGKESAVDAGLHKGSLFVLDQLTRPLHGIAGATDAAITGKNVLRAAGRGLANKDKTTFSKVLKDVGAPGIVQGVGGFGLDVVADPTSYLTLGTGSVIRKEAEAAAANAGKRALSQGLTEDQAARFAERARTKVLKGADDVDPHGLTVKMAGRELPGVRRATAKAVPRRVKRVVRDSRPVTAVRRVGADVNPHAVPDGMTRAQTEETTRAIRTARAKAHRGTYEAQQRALAIEKAVGEDNYRRIIDAVEANDFSRLPADLVPAAHEVRSLFKYAGRVRRQAGLRSGEVTDRGSVHVPPITARTAEDTSRDVARAQRRLTAAQRREREALEERGISQGRAEILSRDVAGAKGETTARRGQRIRVRVTRAEQKPRTGTPQDVLQYMREVEHAHEYPGGSSGVGLGVAKHELAKHDVEAAARDLEHAVTTHQSEKALRAEQRLAANEAERENARRQATAKGYIPHVELEDVAPTKGRRVRRVGGKTVRSRYTGRRADPRPLAVIREEHPGAHSEDLPALLADHLSDAKTAVAKADLNRRLAGEGRPVPRDGSELSLAPDEAVYQITGSNLRLVEDPKELEAVTTATRRSTDGTQLRPSYQARQGGKFVILNREAVDRALEGVNPTPSAGKYGIGAAYDRAQGKFKTLATVPNLGFHVRNLIGDTQNAYLGESAPRLARNIGQSARALRQLGRHEEALRHLGERLDPTDKGVQIGGRHVSYTELVQEAEQVGAIRSGFIARELPELAQKDVTRKPDRLRRLSRLMQNREDVIRLATYLGARKRGLSPERAAERSAEFHFDYSDLTPFERNVARRVMPFYTFTARNLPLQFKSLITHPGKYANFEKLREEAVQATGVDDPPPAKVRHLYRELERAGVKLPHGWESYLSDTERTAAAIPVNVGGHTYTVSAGLPLTDLAMVPGAAGLDDWAHRVMGLLSPIIKDPLELVSNYSSFFDGPIESDTSPLVSAPSFVAKFPADAKHKLGIVRGIDKSTGEPVWKWPGKVAYVAHAVPGPTNWAQQFTTNRAGGLASTALSFSGIKAVPFDPTTAAINLAYERMSEIERRQAAVRQQAHHGKPISADNPTPEYKRLAAQLKLTQEVAYQGRKTRGDATLPTTGKPSHSSTKSTSGFNWDDQANTTDSGFDWSTHEKAAAGSFDWGDK